MVNVGLSLHQHIYTLVSVSLAALLTVIVVLLELAMAILYSVPIL